LLWAGLYPGQPTLSAEHDVEESKGFHIVGNIPANAFLW